MMAEFSYFSHEIWLILESEELLCQPSPFSYDTFDTALLAWATATLLNTQKDVKFTLACAIDSKE